MRIALEIALFYFGVYIGMWGVFKTGATSFKDFFEKMESQDE